MNTLGRTALVFYILLVAGWQLAAQEGADTTGAAIIMAVAAAAFIILGGRDND